MCSYLNSTGGLVYISPPPPPSEQSISKDLQHLNMKSESDGRQDVWKKEVAFMDKNHLAAAGFYYTNSSGVVCCALELGH
jgi:hypothetical protein